MPPDLKIATAQFENRSGDKAFNLSVIDQLTARAAQSGADAIAFHECSVTGYSFARRLSKAELQAQNKLMTLRTLPPLAGTHRWCVACL